MESNLTHLNPKNKNYRLIIRIFGYNWIVLERKRKNKKLRLAKYMNKN